MENDILYIIFGLISSIVAGLQTAKAKQAGEYQKRWKLSSQALKETCEEYRQVRWFAKTMINQIEELKRRNVDAADAMTIEIQLQNQVDEVEVVANAIVKEVKMERLLDHENKHENEVKAEDGNR